MGYIGSSNLGPTLGSNPESLDDPVVFLVTLRVM